MIIFLTPNVFAQDFNVQNEHITSPIAGGRTGTYTGTEIYNTGSTQYYNIGTRYNGRLSRIIFNLISGGYADANGFEKGHTYTLSMNMATQDWRNNFGSVSVTCEGTGSNLSNGRVTFISMYKIKFSFTAPTDRWCQFVYVDLKSSSVSNTAFTGTSNWNLSSMVISDPAYSSGGSGSGSGSGSGTIDPNQSIIDNANQNTTNIIDNANQNTTDIIDNANQNTDKIIKEFEKCRDSYNLLDAISLFNSRDVDYSYSNGLFTLNNLGSPSSNSLYMNPYVLSLENGTTYTLSLSSYSQATNNVRIELVKGSTTVASLSAVNGANYTFTADSSTYSLRFNYSGAASYPLYFNKIMLNVGSSALPYEKYGEQVCANRLDEQTGAINNVNDSLNNSNVDSGVGSDFFSDFDSNDFGFSDIIKIPLTTIQQLTSTSCVNIQIPIPFTNRNKSRTI